MKKTTRTNAAPPMRNCRGESLLWSHSIGIMTLMAKMPVLRTSSAKPMDGCED